MSSVISMHEFFCTVQFVCHIFQYAIKFHSAAEHSSAVKGSVFEDNVVAFKEEDTPVEFSRATSLSSLTIDDEPKISNDAVLKVQLCILFM
jgi:hypothetical protein